MVWFGLSSFFQENKLVLASLSPNSIECGKTEWQKVCFSEYLFAWPVSFVQLKYMAGEIGGKNLSFGFFLCEVQKKSTYIYDDDSKYHHDSILQDESLWIRYLLGYTTNDTTNTTILFSGKR